MANDFNMTNNTSNNRWDLTYTVDASGTKTKTLETAGTFVDRDIQVAITTPAAKATISGSTEATVPTIARTSTTADGATNIGSGFASTIAPTSGYFVTLQATAPATIVSLTKTVNTAGYLSANIQITASASTTAKTGSVYYLPITTGIAAANTASVSKVTTDGSNAGVNIIASIGNATTTEPTSGYYAAFTGTGSSKVTTAGWFPTGNLAAATSATTYFPITSAVGSVTMTAGAGVCSYGSGTHITVSDTDTSGVAVTFKGKGSVSATAKITTAGYTPTNNSFATGASTSSSEVSLTKYITGVELVAGKSFSITVPNGSATDKITFVFTVDSNNNVTVAEN